MVDQANQDHIVERLCNVWTELDGERDFVLCRPDIYQPRACDAIVWRDGRTWAIEHTRIHTIPERLYHLKRMDDFKRPVREALHAGFPRNLLNIRILMSEIPKATAAPAVAAAIIKAAAEILSTLRREPVGTYRVVDDAPGVPFTLMVIYGGSAKNGEGRVFTGPYGPDDRLAKADLRRALEKKHRKLARYRARGAGTVLLLDVPETAALPRYFVEMFRDLAAEVSHDAYDEVVLAGSMWPPPFFTYLKRNRVLVGPGEFDVLFDAGWRIEQRGSEGAGA